MMKPKPLRGSNHFTTPSTPSRREPPPEPGSSTTHPTFRTCSLAHPRNPPREVERKRPPSNNFRKPEELRGHSRLQDCPRTSRAISPAERIFHNRRATSRWHSSQLPIAVKGNTFRRVKKNVCINVFTTLACPLWSLDLFGKLSSCTASQQRCLLSCSSLPP